MDEFVRSFLKKVEIDLRGDILPLCGALPRHRQRGHRAGDTPLIPQNETPDTTFLVCKASFFFVGAATPSYPL